MISLKMLEALTAAEAFDLVLDQALRREQGGCALPEDGGFECRVLEKCFKTLQFKDRIESCEDLVGFSGNVLRRVRAFFVSGAAASEMAGAAGEVSACISEVCEPVGMEALTMISVQITAALYSLMKKHAQYERMIHVLDGLEDCMGVRAEQFRRLLLCLEDCDDPELDARRAGVAFSVCGLRFVRTYREEFLVSGREVPELSASLDVSTPEAMAERMNSDPHALPGYVGAIMKAPLAWLMRFYGRLEGIARRATGMALERIYGNIGGLDGDVALAVDRAMKDQNAFMDWLLGREVLRPAGHRGIGVLLDALRRREGEDAEWYVGVLRHTWEEDLSSGLWSVPDGMEVFWRMEAYRECGNPERAVALYSERMAQGLETPVLWWLLAECHLDMKQFGQAEHDLEQAACRGTGRGMWAEVSEARWQSLLSGVRQRLGRLALDTARQSKVLESALLELAMTYGSDAVVSEAALCAFDGNACGLDVICGMLARRPEARNAWLEALVLRHDEARADALYGLSKYLEGQGDCSGEALLLEAASQMSDPYCAAVTLRHALEMLSPSDALYWTAADMWIDIETRMGAFDDALLGVADAFVVAHPRATKALMFLIARSPKEAFGMIRDLLVERIGMDAAKAAFERIRQGKHREVQTVPEASCAVDDMFEMLLPLSMSVLFRNARLNGMSREARMRAERKECVLRARGLIGSKYEHAPEPAAWEHHQQVRASDAFDV
ncbi:MAG: hypothetical protein IJ165_13205 [Proteobacteria bacterium]|nr:hypothetical protein [Pseudomonadota bacterium]